MDISKLAKLTQLTNSVFQERSPEQFGLMFRTLPPLMSGHLNTSAPVSSQTIPSSLQPKELTNRKVHNGIHQHRSTGSNNEGIYTELHCITLHCRHICFEC